MEGASITIPYMEWEEVRSARAKVEEELAEVKAKLQEARLGGNDADTRRLAEALENLYPVVQFAMANLDPIATRGWPHEALAQFAKLLPDLPISPFIRESTNDLRMFARNASEWEQARKEGTAEEKLREENAATGASQFLGQVGQ
jgi:hypothetical protein